MSPRTASPRKAASPGTPAPGLPEHRSKAGPRSGDSRCGRRARTCPPAHCVEDRVSARACPRCWQRGQCAVPRAGWSEERRGGTLLPLLLKCSRVEALLVPRPPEQPTATTPEFRNGGVGVSLCRPNLLHDQESLFQCDPGDFAANCCLYKVPLFNFSPLRFFLPHCCRPVSPVLTPRRAPDSHFSDSDVRSFNYWLVFGFFFFTPQPIFGEQGSANEYP